MSRRISLSERSAKALLEIRNNRYLPVDQRIHRAWDELEEGLKRKPLREAVKTTRQQKALKRKGKWARTAEVRREVARRANLVCECGCERWFRGLDGAATMDHFWGIAREESIESCWMLRLDCHNQKGASDPSRERWLEKFRAHARYYGYTEQAEKATAELDRLFIERQAREAGQLSASSEEAARGAR